MKFRLALLISAIFIFQLPTAPSQAATIPASCDSIARDSAVKKGITLPCLDSKSSIAFSSLRGPLVVNVWGSWCEPCNQELPYLKALHKRGKVALIGVDVEERNLKSAIAFAKKQRIAWPNLYDVDSKTRTLFGLGVPVTWFINKNGKVVYKHIGVLKSQAELFAEIKKYLGVSA